ncbi:MAG: D-tyrosyl-tRNA(Tyr) deacylase [Bacteroidia bacterium]|nr:MAG: D-tyrosyl-tRNA(Tyr) deacylase [Bacteroidia bacterium]
MRVVIQKVEKAGVEIEGRNVASIGKGLLVFLGVEDADSVEDIEWLSGKISRLRVFDDPEGVMNLSVQDVQGEILVISQFTLHASTKKGNRPSYIRASKPDHAIPMYEAFVEQLAKESKCRVCSGEFGAYMKVSLINDGPVTIQIDSQRKE